MQPKLSVIIPCYNVGKYLPRLLDSILIQTYDNVEIVCVTMEVRIIQKR